MDKYQTAIVQMVLAQDKLKRQTKEISEALQASYEEQTKDQVFSAFLQKEHAYIDYLARAYEMETDEESSRYGFVERYYPYHDGDVEAYLAEHDKHALQAHKIIQERKKTKKELGIAKRRVALLGRNLLKNTYY